MTIEQYLQGKVDLYISDNTIASILFDRDIPEGIAVEMVSQRQKDLALADLYMFVAGSSTSSTGEYESDGGWQRNRSAKNAYNRNGLMQLAKMLYAKWNEEVYDPTPKIRMKPLY